MAAFPDPGAEWTGSRHILVSGSSDHTVRLWDVMTGEGVYQRKLVGGKKITAVSVCSVDVAEQGAVEREVKGVVAASGDDRVVRLYDLVSGVALATFEGHEGGVSSLDLFVGLMDPKVSGWAVGEYTVITAYWVALLLL